MLVKGSQGWGSSLHQNHVAGKVGKHHFPAEWGVVPEGERDVEKTRYRDKSVRSPPAGLGTRSYSLFPTAQALGLL